MTGFVRQVTMGFCWWDLAAALVFATIVAIVTWRRNCLDRRIRELEDRIAEQYMDDSLQEITFS